LGFSGERPARVCARPATALEGAERQVHEVVDHLAAEGGVEPAAGVARDVAAQRAQQPLEHEQRDHAERQHIQGLERAVRDHLVVDGNLSRESPGSTVS
jgi:hypothetical protein